MAGRAVAYKSREGLQTTSMAALRWDPLNSGSGSREGSTSGLNMISLVMSVAKPAAPACLKTQARPSLPCTHTTKLGSNVAIVPTKLAQMTTRSVRADSADLQRGTILIAEAGILPAAIAPNLRPSQSATRAVLQPPQTAAAPIRHSPPVTALSDHDQPRAMRLVQP